MASRKVAAVESKSRPVSGTSIQKIVKPSDLYSKQLPRKVNTAKVSPNYKRSGVKARLQSNQSDFYEADSNIKFINVEKPYEEKISTGSSILTGPEILAKSGEAGYDDVYDLDLARLQLSEIPNLEKFSKVRKLDLSSNHLDKITQLDCCKEIRELKLYDNNLTVIEKLDSLADLCHLQLQYNRISSIGKCFSGCLKLNILRLDSNNIAKIDEREIAFLSKLTHLDLSNNKLETINALNTLPCLQELRVSRNRLRSIDLPRCKQLEEVDCSENRLSSLQCFAVNAGSLNILNVSKNCIGRLDVSIPFMRLEELYATDNTVKILSTLSKLFPALQVLDLRNNKISDKNEIGNITECPEIRELYLSGNDIVSSTDSLEIKSHIPSLEVLDAMPLKNDSHEPRVPLMRPMSASNAISSRQVEVQIDSLNSQLLQYKLSVEKTFENVRQSLDQVPLAALKKASNMTGPSSKASRQSRLREAKLFASHEYTS